MRKVRRGIGFAVLAVVSALLVIGCGGGGGQSGGGGGGAETVKIVSDLPRQGANRAQTTTMVNAIELAIEQRNGKAGRHEDRVRVAGRRHGSGGAVG